MTHTDAPDPLLAWIASMSREDLHELVLHAAESIPEFGQWLDARRALGSDDPKELLGVVNTAFTPRKRFYYYREAMDYAAGAYDVADLLEAASESGSAELLKVIERAITLATRAILRSDDSAGAQGDLISALLESHARAARTATPPLTQGEQTRLVNWLVKYRYGGIQDMFDPDIVAYAPALSAKSLQRYRDAIASIGHGPYGSYALRRLAVLDKDKDAIISGWGDGLKNAMVATRVVADLREAGLYDDAVEHAYQALPSEAHFSFGIVDFLVEDALARDDGETAVSLRRQRFEKEPNVTTFGRLKETAKAAGLWEREREAAEHLLGERNLPGFIVHLLQDDRAEEAWGVATTRLEPDADVWTWLALCEQRAKSHPSDTLPIYERSVRRILMETDKKNYRWAAAVLKDMRAAAEEAGREAVFAGFLATIREENRRRPACIAVLDRAGLM